MRCTSSFRRSAGVAAAFVVVALAPCQAAVAGTSEPGLQVAPASSQSAVSLPQPAPPHASPLGAPAAPPQTHVTGHLPSSSPLAPSSSTPLPLQSGTYPCNCYDSDPCTGQGLSSSTTCQACQSCSCQEDWEYHFDGPNCLLDIYAVCQ